MLPQLEGFNWGEVFKYVPPEPAAPGVTVDCAPFDREDVVELLGIVEGENEGPDWICYGRLRDGRFFSIRAGCDYTGWG